MPLLLSNARLVLDPSQGEVPGWLLIKEGLIAGLGREGESFPSCVPEIDCQGDFLAPGLIDLHAHGAVGRDAMEASSGAFGEVLAEHARQGTTTVVLTTVAASIEEIIRVIRTAGEWRGLPGAARLEGIHIEGPWFSSRRCGAHDAAQLRFPSPEETAAMLKHREVIRRITLAPELPGALGAIRSFKEACVSVSAGHSDATENEAVQGFQAGITQVTHLHNAMSSLRKTDPSFRGLAEAALEADGILCELIADGVHVSGHLLREAFLTKGWERMALVSDATAGAGLPEGASFKLGMLSCRVDNDAARTVEREGEKGRLAGSTQFLKRGIRTMMEQAGATLAEAVAMATLVPARALRLEHERGSLEVGKKADLFRFSKGWEQRGVWIAGEPVF